MIDLNSPVWNELGSGEVPALLRGFSDAPDGESLSNLTEALVDQGAVAPGAYAAVPHLIDITMRLSVVDQADLWDLIGYITSRAPRDQPSLPADVRNKYLA